MGNRGRKALRKTGYILFLLLFTFLALEILLRIYNPFPSRIKGEQIILPTNQVYYFRNNIDIESIDKEVRVQYNSLGFQGPEKPANFDSCLSMVTVGGSTTACMYISTEKTWPTLLGNQLSTSFRNVWLNNAGKDGHSSFGHMFMLRDHLIPLKPKLIIFLTGINDVDRTDLAVHEDKRPRSLARFVLRHSEVANIVVAFLRNRKAISKGLIREIRDFKTKNNDTLQLSEDTMQLALKYQQPMVQAYERRMRAVIDTCLAHNIKPVLLTQPLLTGGGIDTLSGMNLDKVRIVRGINGELWARKLDLYNHALKRLAKERSLLCIDLAAMLPKSTRYYYDFVHYTNAGTQKIVELITPELEAYLQREFPAYRK